MAFEALHSSTFKVLGIGVLALLMLIPLVQVQGLIAERNALRSRLPMWNKLKHYIDWNRVQEDLEGENG